MFGTKSKALVCGFVISILFSFISFSNKCEGISNKIFRLHIMANSDSAEDQALKLKVRDRILSDFADDFRGSEDLISAEKTTQENIEKIRKSAQDEVSKRGYKYIVNAEITRMNFNTRNYSEITLPAGCYDALRITIGTGEGKNWWCVMFPPMCLPAAQEKSEMELVLNSSELDIANGGQKYKVEFKVVEFFIKTKDFFQSRVWSPVEDFASFNIPEKYAVDFKLVHVFSEIKSFNINE